MFIIIYALWDCASCHQHMPANKMGDIFMKLKIIDNSDVCTTCPFLIEHQCMVIQKYSCLWGYPERKEYDFFEVFMII